MSGYILNAQHALVLRVGRRGVVNALDNQHVAHAVDFVGHPLSEHFAADFEIGGRIHGIGGGQIADAEEHRHAATVRVFHDRLSAVGLKQQTIMASTPLSTSCPICWICLESLRFDWVMTACLIRPSLFHFGVVVFCRRLITSARQGLPE